MVAPNSSPAPAASWGCELIPLALISGGWVSLVKRALPALAAVCVALMVGLAVHTYGNRREAAGAAGIQQKWNLDVAQRDRAEALRQAAVARAEALNAQQNRTLAARQAAITLEATRDSLATTTDLRARYGPGRVRRPSAESDRGKADGVRAGTEDPGRVAAGPADAGLGADAPAAEVDAEDCQRLASDAAVTTANYLFMRDWLDQQGLIER